jgi:signal recognition particle receptor subunit beta
MDINLVSHYKIPSMEDKGNLDIMDIPGQGFFKTRIMDVLNNSKIIIVFLDSNEKTSISSAAEYLYDILNNENFDETINIIIACNKQDLKFSKNKKIIESELNNELENIKTIKQKNNLEETSHMGALYNMKSRFRFEMFKNIHFVETEKTNNFSSLTNIIKQLI